MRFRRNMFLLLAGLVVALTALMLWLVVALADVQAQLACTALSPTARCDEVEGSPDRLLVAGVAVAGGVSVLSFLWLAWQETRLLRRCARRGLGQRIFAQTGLLVHTGNEEQPCP